jgi:hypothetical protein
MPRQGITSHTLSEVLRIRARAWPNLRIIGFDREQLRIRPHLEIAFRENGRGREVDMALSGDWS